MDSAVIPKEAVQVRRGEGTYLLGEEENTTAVEAGPMVVGGPQSLGFGLPLLKQQG